MPRVGTALSLEEAKPPHRTAIRCWRQATFSVAAAWKSFMTTSSSTEVRGSRALAEAQADTVVSGRLPSPLLIDKFLQDAIRNRCPRCAVFDGKSCTIGGMVKSAGAGVWSATPPHCRCHALVRLPIRRGAPHRPPRCRSDLTWQYAFHGQHARSSSKPTRVLPYRAFVHSRPPVWFHKRRCVSEMVACEIIADQRANNWLLPRRFVAIHPG